MSRKFLVPVLLPADPTIALEAVTKQYVDARAGSEVEIGTSDPIGTNAAAELWYDTDAPAADADSWRWNSAWGIVAMGGFVSASVVLPANVSTPITTTASAFLAVGRRYRVVLACRAVGPPSGTAFVRLELFNGTTSLFSSGQPLVNSPASNYNAVHYSWILNGDDTTKALSVRAQSESYANTLYTDVSWFYVEDVGPNQSSPLPVPETPPPWTPLAYGHGGWTNIGGTSAPLSYRKIGDVVEMRGEVHFGSGGNPMATLPVGFRPAYAQDFPFVKRDNVPAGGALSFVGGIDPNGQISVYGIAGATDFSISTVRFSVTP